MMSKRLDRRPPPPRRSVVDGQTAILRPISRFRAGAYRRIRFPRGAPTKVFRIGFNKTGTSSLRAFFSELGLKTCHERTWTTLTDMNDPFFGHYEAFTDGEQAPFELLDQAFSGSKFFSTPALWCRGWQAE